MPFGKTIGSNNIFSNANNRSLMYRVKNNRLLKIQLRPLKLAFTSLVTKGLRLSLADWPIFKAHDEVE